MSTKLEAYRLYLKAQMAEIDQAIADHEKAVAELEQRREELIDDDAGQVIVGKCDQCGRALFVGDRAFSYDDGPMFCEQHAPTWTERREELDDLKRDGIFVDSFESPEDAEATDALVDKRIAEGRGDERITWEL